MKPWLVLRVPMWTDAKDAHPADAARGNLAVLGKVKVKQQEPAY
jgi:hypothetical protein